MYKYDAKPERRGRRSRKRKRKKRIQLFLNFSMLVCIVMVIFRIGVLENRENMAYDVRMDSGQTSDDFVQGWELTLVNKWNPLPEGAEAEIIELANGERVDKRIYPYLQEMFDDARAEGIYPIVRSGYRTRQEQTDIYEERMQRYQADGLTEAEARTETELWVAVPGTSEHELGLAVDINADRIHSGSEEVYAWLGRHAHLYGFINRYPSDKTDITGVANEPWHYRYVGTAAAAEIYERGICLEEYLEDYHADDATLMHR